MSADRDGLRAVHLLDLPQAVLSDILSWCDGRDSVDALLASCRTLHALRRLPTAAALLLVRCPPYCTALVGAVNVEPHISHLAVPAAIFQLLHAGPEAGGPHIASPQLMQGLLCCAAWNGNVALLRRLQALPSPLPCLSLAGLGLLARAISHGGSLQLIELLLDLGADPLHDGGYGMPLAHAAGTASQLQVVRRLLQHYPPPEPHVQGAFWVGTAACTAALVTDNAAALALLLPLSPFSPGATLRIAASRNRSHVVQWLTQGGGLSEDDLGDALSAACRNDAVACAQILVVNGAAGHWHELLREAVELRRIALVELLLHSGARATEEMMECAERQLPHSSSAALATCYLPSYALADLLRLNVAQEGQRYGGDARDD